MRFEEFLRDLGLKPGAIVPDEKVRRCATEGKPKKKNGAYWLSLDGTFGWGQDWEVHEDAITWHPEDEKKDVPTYDPARMARARAEARDRGRERLEAIAAAQRFYESCAPLLGGHPYLDAHELDMTGCYGLKVDADGWLVVPMQRRNTIVSVQRISPDGTKLFWKDAPARAATYMLKREGAPVKVLCEGLATGLALYACIPNASVLVAFNTGNMTEPDVLERVGAGTVVVASDNDQRTVCKKHRAEGLERPLDPRKGLPEGCRCNPGILKALEAAEALGCGVAVPEGIDGTDWADYRQERTREELARKNEHTPESAVRQKVDAKVKMEVMRYAKLRILDHAGDE